MESDQIRNEFINYFIKNSHRLFPSDSLVPSKDPTLLFTSAGMVQFKEYFIKKDEKIPRAVSCQKCLRTSDIEKIGYTPRHLSFFEMLGNFSFGDYFKEEAIYYAWDFLINVLKIDRKRLYITIYKDDNEAYKEWQKYIDKSRIYKLGEDTNFWTMGPVGPCGPCSEIIYDLGKEMSCGKDNCNPGCDCSRWLEVWNLVFTQFNRDNDGKLLILKQKNIDTGMGLERITAILNGKKSVFETDLFINIINEIDSLAKIKSKNYHNCLRIIADHTRAVTFLIAEGVFPSNEGRGYVTRRLLRRAARYAKLIGIDGAFLWKLSEKVIERMKNIYKLLDDKKENIHFVIKQEEEKFLETIDTGMNILERLIEEKKQKGVKKISGKDVFALYDTYGFPWELTDEILAEHGLSYEKEEFENERKKSQEISKQSWKTIKVDDISIYREFAGKVKFTGYSEFSTSGKVIAILKNGLRIKELTKNEEGEIILDKTPFYGEGGGQVGDKGILKNDNIIAEVIDTQKYVEDVVVHRIKVIEGKITENDILKAEIDIERRKAIMRHHTATHLLHRYLREVLGSHVIQQGSFVDNERLRFDFTHFSALENLQINKIEQLINKSIMSCIPVKTFFTTIENAKQIGAMALFGEKYKETVRCVIIGGEPVMNETGKIELKNPPAVSIELCGGTHCSNTGEIGMMKIISESSAGSNIRRIEAICGNRVYQYINSCENIIDEITQKLKSTKSEISVKIDKILQQNKKLQEEIEYLKENISLDKKEDKKNNIFKIKDYEFIINIYEGISMKNLRNLNDRIKKEHSKNTIIILLNSENQKVSFVVGVTKDVISKGINAIKISRKIAEYFNGSAGGRDDFAQGGGKLRSDFDENSILKIIGDDIKN